MLREERRRLDPQEVGRDARSRRGAREIKKTPEVADERGRRGLEVAASDEPFVFASQTYEGSLIVLGCKLALAVPTVQQAWASSGVRAGDRIVAVNGTAGPAEKLLSLLRRDNKKRRLTLVRPQTEESMG